MFDWNENEVGDPIWGELDESGDHIVPFPALAAKYSTLCAYGDPYERRRNDESVSSDESIQRVSSSWVNHDLHWHSMENNSGFNSSGFPQRHDMDVWPDLPSLSPELAGVRDDVHILGSMPTAGRLDGPSEYAADKEKVRAQLDSDSDVFVNARGDTESGSFLDYDRNAFGDFGDFENIFGNDSIFGHENVNGADGFLSTTSDVINGTLHSLPMPDFSVSKDQPFEKGCSSFQFEKHTNPTWHPENDKVTDALESNEERAYFEGHLIGDYSGHGNHLDMEQRKGTADNAGYPSPANLLMPSGHGYPTELLHSGSLLVNPKHEKNQMRIPASAVCASTQYPLEENDYGIREYAGKRPTMTLQEKIEKLRRRQQMKAMLAIQQQQQQLGHKTSGFDSSASQTSSQKGRSRDATKSTARHEGSGIEFPSVETKVFGDKFEPQKLATTSNSRPSPDTVYNDLKNAMNKLDAGVRLCIRDSLFRLAKSATERRTSSDRSSTNKSNRVEGEVVKMGDAVIRDRFSKFAHVETNTNPLDRTVAHLLFHTPLESSSCSRPARDNTHHSPASRHPAPEAPSGSAAAAAYKGSTLKTS